MSFFMLIPKRHGAHLATKSGADDHDDMNDCEQNQREEGGEMESAGRLEAAEHS
jgi:hypothetical protein